MHSSLQRRALSRSGGPAPTRAGARNSDSREKMPETLLNMITRRGGVKSKKLPARGGAARVKEFSRPLPSGGSQTLIRLRRNELIFIPRAASGRIFQAPGVEGRKNNAGSIAELKGEAPARKGGGLPRRRACGVLPGATLIGTRSREGPRRKGKRKVTRRGRGSGRAICWEKFAQRTDVRARMDRVGAEERCREF